MIFWVVIIPITTYGSYIWILCQKDNENLDLFQRYAGRGFQRFNMISSNYSSFYGLGGISINTVIYIKNLMFAFSLIKMDEGNCIRQLFRQRGIDFNVNIQKGIGNNLHSPFFEILKQVINLEYVRYL